MKNNIFTSLKRMAKGAIDTGRTTTASIIAGIKRSTTSGGSKKQPKAYDFNELKDEHNSTFLRATKKAKELLSKVLKGEEARKQDTIKSSSKPKDVKLDTEQYTNTNNNRKSLFSRLSDAIRGNKSKDKDAEPTIKEPKQQSDTEEKPTVKDILKSTGKAGIEVILPPVKKQRERVGENPISEEVLKPLTLKNEKDVLTPEEQQEYMNLQNKVNQNVLDALEKLTPEEREYAENVPGLTDTDSFPVNQIWSRERFEEKKKKLEEEANSENILNDREKRSIEVFENVFSKSKFNADGVSSYIKMDGGKLYGEFIEALKNADSITRYDFFNKEFPLLTEKYQDGNADSDGYDEETLKKNLIDMTNMLKRDTAESKYKEAYDSMRNK